MTKSNKKIIEEWNKVILSDEYDKSIKELEKYIPKQLEELVKDCNEDNRHEEVDWGKPEGKEIW